MIFGILTDFLGDGFYLLSHRNILWVEKYETQGKAVETQNKNHLQQHTYIHS